MAYKVGAGSQCQVGLQSAWGTPVAPTVLVNMTSESMKVTVNKGDEGNLLASKTANQRDLLGIAVDGSISTILRPEFVDWLLEAALGTKTTNQGVNVYTLKDPNNDLPISTLVLSRGGVVKTYPNVTIKSIKLSAAAQDYVKCDIDVAGVKELSAGDTGAQTLATLSFTKPSYRCTSATLYYGAGGTAKASLVNTLCVESCEITIDNGVEDAPATYCSGFYKDRPVMGLRNVTVNFTIPYSDAIDTFRKTYFLGESSPCVALKLEFTTSDTDEKFEVYIPNVNITTGDGNVGGSGIIDTSFAGEALSVGATEPITISVTHHTPVLGTVGIPNEEPDEN